MTLHARDVLQALLDRHTRAFALVHGAIDRAIQDVCAAWVQKYPDLHEVKGGVFAASVRQAVLFYLEKSQFQHEDFQGTTDPLCAQVGPFCSVILCDLGGEQARVRKHPTDYRTGELVPVEVFPEETLFGTDYSTHPWKPYVVWTADLGTQTLAKAGLAAVADIDNPSKTVIYDKIDLPVPILPITSERIPPSVLVDEENWDQYWQEEGHGGPDPA